MSVAEASPSCEGSFDGLAAGRLAGRCEGADLLLVVCLDVADRREVVRLGIT